MRVVQAGIRYAGDRTAHMRSFSTDNCQSSQKCEVRWILGKGYGLFALSDIRKGSFLCTYSGQILSTAEARQRWTRQAETGRGNYILVLKETISSNDGRLETLKTIVDPTYVGNVGRFMSAWRACPTCNARPKTSLDYAEDAAPRPCLPSCSNAHHAACTGCRHADPDASAFRRARLGLRGGADLGLWRCRRRRLVLWPSVRRSCRRDTVQVQQLQVGCPRVLSSSRRSEADIGISTLRSVQMPRRHPLRCHLVDVVGLHAVVVSHSHRSVRDSSQSPGGIPSLLRTTCLLP